MHQNKRNPKPKSTSTDALVSILSKFYSQKMADTMRELDNESSPITNHVSLASHYISKVVMKSPSKSCVLDALPTHLLKDCLSVLAPFLTELVNQSLEQGQFPSISALVKKPEFDSSFNNYSQISKFDLFILAH